MGKGQKLFKNGENNVKQLIKINQKHRPKAQKTAAGSKKNSQNRVPKPSPTLENCSVLNATDIQL